MPPSNVDQFLDCAAAFNRLAATPEAFKFADVEAWLSAFDPEVRFEPQQSEIDGGYVGHYGLLRWLTDLAAHYGPGRLEFTDVRDLGDSVLGLGTIHIVGKASGIETEVPSGVVATFRDGLITNFKDYGHHEDAIAACASS